MVITLTKWLWLMRCHCNKYIAQTKEAMVIVVCMAVEDIRVVNGKVVKLDMLIH